MAASMHNFLSVGMESFVQHTSFEDPSAAPPPHTAASDMEVAHLCGTCSQQSSFFFLKTQAQHPPPLHTAASDTEVAHLSVERSQQNSFFFSSLTEEQYSLLSLLLTFDSLRQGKSVTPLSRTLLLSFIIVYFYLPLSFVIDVWELASAKERDAIVRTRKLIDDERSRLQQECILEALLGAPMYTYVCMYVCILEALLGALIYVHICIYTYTYT